jgi:hypothetical protein
MFWDDLPPDTIVCMPAGKELAGWLMKRLERVPGAANELDFVRLSKLRSLDQLKVATLILAREVDTVGEAMRSLEEKGLLPQDSSPQI